MRHGGPETGLLEDRPPVSVLWWQNSVQNARMFKLADGTAVIGLRKLNCSLFSQGKHAFPACLALVAVQEKTLFWTRVIYFNNL